MSPLHIDAGNFCTYVSPAAGTKLWLLLGPEGPAPPDHLSMIDPTKYKWVGIVLNAGDTL